jgi:hypothetical protein
LAAGDATGWYVLAGDQRPFAFALSPGICAKAATVTIDVTGSAVVAKRTFEHVAKQCGAS